MSDDDQLNGERFVVMLPNLHGKYRNRISTTEIRTSNDRPLFWHFSSVCSLEFRFDKVSYTEE